MLDIKEATRYYGSFCALDKVSFSVQPGEIVGLLGPNGSGKTTLLRMISTYMYPTAGTITVGGIDTVNNPLAVRQQIGYLPESNILYDTMVVRNYLEFVGRAKGLDGAALQARIDWLTERCELAPLLKKKCGECSRGMRQRVAFSAALINDPPVLLLDEPTAGLDPLQSNTFRALIHSLAANRVILFSSHLMSEVAAVSPRVVLIHNGHLLADLTLAEGDRRAETLEKFFIDTIAKSQTVTETPA